jgi:hypothetical protein
MRAQVPTKRGQNMSVRVCFQMTPVIYGVIYGTALQAKVRCRGAAGWCWPLFCLGL